MKTFIEAMTEKDALTANGAVTHSTSHNYNLDLFFLAGACRNEQENKIISVLNKSYNFDRLKTLKIIFWAGDIRQGAGERRFFKLALNWLNENHPEDIQNNLDNIPEFSRWDVIFELAMKNEVLFSYIIANLADKTSKGHGLLCKWLPRKVRATDKKKKQYKNGNTTSVTITRKKRLLYDGIAGKIMKRLELTPKQYRKLLVEGTKVVEQQMCAKKWNKIEYSKVPSVAINKYNKAWYRNDKQRFESYIEQVKAGKSKMNASAIFPHDIIKSVLSCAGWSMSISKLNEAQVAQWNSLPNYLGDSINEFIPVCDTSGSMYGTPIQMCLALGLYLSERNQGPFKDAFITFSSNPELQYLHGDISSRLLQLAHAKWGQSTNLVGVFDLILEKAKEANLSQEMMPKKILIISDMEFNSCARLTNYQAIKLRYLQNGYQIPQIVFWNVNGRAGNCPVNTGDYGTALISGASPSIVKSILTGDIDPVAVMNKTIESERYSVVK